MNPSFQELALFSLIFLPAVASIFIILVPKFDIRAVRQITMSVLSLWAFLLFVLFKNLQETKTAAELDFFFEPWLHPTQRFMLSFESLDALLLFTIWFSLFSFVILGKRIVEKNSLLFSSLIMVLLASSTMCILSSNLQVSILLAHFTSVIFFFLLAHFGGPRKGSALYVSSIFLLAVDLSAFAVVMIPSSFWQGRTVFLSILLLSPALSRLLVPFFAPFAKPLFKSCPIENAVLYVTFLVPVGASLLLQMQPTLTFHNSHSKLLPWLGLIVFFCLLLLVFKTLTENDPRKVGIDLLSFYNCIFVLFFLTFGPKHNLKTALIIFSGVISAQFTLHVGHWLYLQAKDGITRQFLYPIWFSCLMLWFCIPGIGMGTSLWVQIYDYAEFSKPISFHTLSLWLTVFLLLGLGLMKNFDRFLLPQNQISSLLNPIASPIPTSRQIWSLYTLVVALCAGVAILVLTKGA